MDFSIVKSFLRERPRQFVTLTLLFVLENVLEVFGVSLVIPVFLRFLGQPAVDKFSLKLDELFRTMGLEPSLTVVVSALVLAFVFKSLIMWVSRSYTATVCAGFYRDTQTLLLNAFLNARLESIHKIREGTYVNSLVQESHRAALTYLYTAQWGSYALSFLAFSAVLLSLSLPLTAFVFLLSLVIFWPLKELNRKSDQVGRAQLTLQEGVQADLMDIVAGIKVTKAEARENWLMAQLLVKLNKGFDLWRSTYFMSGAVPLISHPMGVAIVGGIVLVGSAMQMPVPHVLLFLVAVQRMVPQFSSMQNLANNIAVCKPGATKVKELLSLLHSVAESSGHIVFKELKEGIQLDEVSFHYQSDAAAIFSNVSFKIHCGEIVAFIGKSGQGKTTFVDLIVGLHRPQAGQIFIDQVNLQHLDLKSWRSKIAYVSQDPVLFHDSVYNNLIWALPYTPTAEEIQGALRMAVADEFIERLPEGLNTVIGPRGMRLSGGQRQRLSLARALLRKPQILILDEATSALDGETELKIKQFLENLKQTRKYTVIMIAHRSSTVESADRIIKVEKGQLFDVLTQNVFDNWQTNSLAEAETKL